MRNSGLTNEEKYWISTVEKQYSLGLINKINRISNNNPLSGCHIFHLKCQKKQYAIKVYPMGWWPHRLYRAHLTAEFLNEHGFPSPFPLRTNTGDRIAFLGENPEICTTWIQGYSLWNPQKIK